MTMKDLQQHSGSGSDTSAKCSSPGSTPSAFGSTTAETGLSEEESGVSDSQSGTTAMGTEQTMPSFLNSQSNSSVSFKAQLPNCGWVPHLGDGNLLASCQYNNLNWWYPHSSCHPQVCQQPGQVTLTQYQQVPEIHNNIGTEAYSGWAAPQYGGLFQRPSLYGQQPPLNMEQPYWGSDARPWMVHCASYDGQWYVEQPYGQSVIKTSKPGDPERSRVMQACTTQPTKDQGCSSSDENTQGSVTEREVRSCLQLKRSASEGSIGRNATHLKSW